MANNYGEQMLSAFETLINGKIDALSFDKTITGTVVKCTKEATGQYKVKYQDSVLICYSDDVQKKYSAGELVYVSIPNGDFSKVKTIISTVDRDNEDNNYVSGNISSLKYERFGNNLINWKSDENGESLNFGFKAKMSDTDFIIDKQSYYTIDNTQINYIFQNYKHIQFGADFSTNLLSSQHGETSGNYGLIITIYITTSTLDENGNIITQTIDIPLNSSKMNGQPYHFTMPSTQKIIESYNLLGRDDFTYELVSIKAYSDNFKSEQNINDLFVKDIFLYGLVEKTEEQMSGYFLKIDAPNGAIVVNNVDKYLFKPTLLVKNLTTTEATYQWFIEDISVRTDTGGGKGWRLLEGVKDSILTIKPGSIAAEMVIDDCGLTFSQKKTLFKCVSTLDGIKTYRSILFENPNAIDVSITSSNGKTFYNSSWESELTAIPQNNAYTYNWSVDYGDGELIAIDETSNILNISATNFSSYVIYKCTIVGENKIIGTASITLTKDVDVSSRRLTILNGNRVYKYDEDGLNPTSNELLKEDQATIDSLSFRLIGNDGEITEGFDSIEWKIPKGTLLTNIGANEENEKVDTTTSTEYTIVKAKTCSYGIEDEYNFTKNTYAQIELEVVYGGVTYYANTNITFLKEGEVGSNGTKYTAVIYPNTSGAMPYWATYYANNGSWNFEPRDINNPFVAKLYYQGKEIEDTLNIEWSMVSTSSLKLVSTASSKMSGDSESSNHMNILRAAITYEDIKYYAVYPIIYVVGTTNFSLESGGFKTVMYNSNGINPHYNAQPFVLDNVVKVAYTSLLSKYKFSGNKYYFKPASQYNGESLVEGLTVTIDNTLGAQKTAYIPIFFYLNRYGLKNINEWDGNSLEVNNEGGYILASQVAAGHKNNNDNSFSGVVMGEYKYKDENDKDVITTGLFGFKEGNTTFELTEDGNARFSGKMTASTIIIEDKKPEDSYEKGSLGYKIDEAKDIANQASINVTKAQQDATDALSAIGKVEGAIEGIPSKIITFYLSTNTYDTPSKDDTAWGNNCPAWDGTTNIWQKTVWYSIKQKKNADDETISVEEPTQIAITLLYAKNDDTSTEEISGTSNLLSAPKYKGMFGAFQDEQTLNLTNAFIMSSIPVADGTIQWEPLAAAKRHLTFSCKILPDNNSTNIPSVKLCYYITKTTHMEDNTEKEYTTITNGGVLDTESGYITFTINLYDVISQNDYNTKIHVGITRLVEGSTITLKEAQVVLGKKRQDWMQPLKSIIDNLDSLNIKVNDSEKLEDNLEYIITNQLDTTVNNHINLSASGVIATRERQSINYYNALAIHAPEQDTTNFDNMKIIILRNRVSFVNGSTDPQQGQTEVAYFSPVGLEVLRHKVYDTLSIGGVNLGGQENTDNNEYYWKPDGEGGLVFDQKR